MKRTKEEIVGELEAELDDVRDGINIIEETIIGITELLEELRKS